MATTRKHGVSHVARTMQEAKAAPQSEIKAVMAKKAHELLKLAGAQYKIILGDVEYGELEVAVAKTKRVKGTRSAGLPRGTIRSYMRPFLEPLKQPGDVVVVPATPEIRAEMLQPSVGSYMVERYGINPVTTHKRADGDLEVMLVDPLPPTENHTKPADIIEGVNVSALTPEQIEQARQLLG